MNSPLEDLSSQLFQNNILLLPIEINHAIYVSILPFHHRDPFDRIMIAQALAEDMAIVGRDPAFPIYGVPVLW